MTVQIAEGLVFDFVIVGEDARQERHNKWTVAGIFNDQIIIPSLPAGIRLALYCQGKSDRKFAGPLHFKARLDSAEVFKIQGHYECDIGPITLAVPNLVVAIPTEGRLYIEVSTDDQNWITVTSLVVSTGDLPP